MDDNQFDSIAAAIGTAGSRRGVFAALLGGALALAGANALAQDLGVEAKRGDGEPCDPDRNQCGRGLFCKKLKVKKKKGGRRRLKYECRYSDGCGKRNDFCDESDDCCSGLRCDRQDSVCVRN